MSGDCAHDDHFDFAGLDAARRQALLCSLNADVAHTLAGSEDMAFLDAGALHDPLIVGVHHFFEVFIGKNLGRDISSEGAYLGAPAHYGTHGKAQCISPCGADNGVPLATNHLTAARLSGFSPGAFHKNAVGR